MLDADVLIRFTASASAAVRSLAKMAGAFRRFALAFASAVERNPAALRVLSKGLPKKERRKVGRKIRRLERAQVV